MPYKVGLRYGQKQNWWIEGEFRGFETITNDTNTSNRTVRELYLNRVDGGSFQFYSINPSVGEVALIGGLQFESLGIYAGAATTVYGRSMADSWSAIVGVTFTGAIFAPVVRREEFNPRPDKYDEVLFKEKIVPEADITPLPLIVPKPRGPAKPRVDRVRKVRKAAQPEPSVELLMKQTEKTLEKKDN